MKSYRIDLLAAVTPTSLAWATAYVRSVLKDKPNQHGVYPADGLEDEEIHAQLAMDARLFGTTTYYPAHLTAANLLESDPERLISYAAGGVSEGRADPRALAAAIRRRGAAIDTLITSATGVVNDGMRLAY